MASRSRSRSYRVPPRDLDPHLGRRAGTEDAGDHEAPRTRCGASLGPLAFSEGRARPFTRRADRLSNAILRLFGVRPELSRSSTRGRHEGDHPAIRARAATLDPGEAVMLGGVFHLHEQEAREVMTPIPAVVTVDASDTVEDGAAALRLLRPHPPRRDRGRQPRPGPRHRPQQLARPSLHERRGRTPDRAGDPRRADLPRDEAARRPAGRASAPAQLDRGRRGRVRANGRDRHRRGHPRGGRGRDRGRDRPARRSCAGSPTATGTSAATSRSATSRTSASSCRSTSDAFNSIGGYVFSELGRLPKRGDRIIADGYEIRVESVRENRIVAVRIHGVATGSSRAGPPERVVRPRRALTERLRAGASVRAPLASDRPAHRRKGQRMWVVRLTTSSSRS